MRRSNVIFIIMVMISSLGQIISDVYLPSLPAIATGLHSSVQASQFSLSIYMFGFAISLLIYGPISDGVGRRGPLLTGLSLCLIGSIVCFNSYSIQILIIGRLIQGLGAGATLSVTSPILRDLFEGETLAKYSSYSALIGVAFLTMSPLLGGYLQHYFGWRASFIFLSIYTIIALYAVIVKVPETNKHENISNLRITVIKKNLFTLLTSPIFIGYCSCSLLAYGAILAWLTAGPIILEITVGLSPVNFGKAYMLTGIGFGMGAFINAKYVSRYGIQRMLLCGIFCIFLSGVSMAALALMGFVNSFAIISPVMLLFFGASMVFPNTSAGVFQPFPEIAGSASALFYSARMLSGSIFSGVLAIMPHHNQLPMAFAFILSAVLAWIIFYFALVAKQ